ncbi:MAG: dCTP deaminase, partial [Thermoanaerobaculia bacterium]|nr:dCTP deaminase [Thermoanaerobaculia bacterium]
MILSNVGIQAAIDAADLIITPEPAPRRPLEYQGSCPYDTCSVNLRLGSQISIPKPGKPITLDFRKRGAAMFLPEIFETITIDQGGYALAPNKFILAKTWESYTCRFAKAVHHLLRASKAARRLHAWGCSFTSPPQPFMPDSKER